MSVPPPQSRLPLVFPYYIDEDMVTSFLATIEGGLAIVEKVVQSYGKLTQHSLEGSAEINVQLPIVGKGGGSGSGSRASHSSNEEQWETERRHTTISLLNLLRQDLHDRDQVKFLDNENGSHVTAGDIVEFSGLLKDNPFVTLKDVWTTYREMLPYFSSPLGSGTPTQRSSVKSHNQTKNNSSPLSPEEQLLDKIIDMTNSGFSKSGLIDLLTDINNPDFPRAILTLRENANPTQSIAFGNGSQCTVLGKVTGVVSVDQEILLYRRSGLRIFPKKLFDEMLNPLRGLNGVSVEIGDISAKGPALQILPLAVFV